MKYQELIERYIYAATRFMKKEEKEDVSKELNSIIADMLEERCGDKEPDEEIVKEVLSELGDARELYEKYSVDGKDCLIAPSPKKDDTHETGKTHGESYSHAKNGRKLNGSKTTDKKRDDNRHEGNRRGKGDSEYARDSRSKGNTQKGASRNAVRSEKAPKHPPKGRKRR